ncbi:MAG: copper resistance protein CopC [Ardenticatenia bacterium]|nr:copper resistance protein CopC [Ardenticatenia bacterium]
MHQLAAWPTFRSIRSHLPHRGPSVGRQLSASVPTLALATLVAAFGVLLGHGPAVLAHSELLDSVPAAGAEIAAAPSTVALTFSDLLGDGSTVDVLDAGFQSVAAGPAVVDAAQPHAMSLPLTDLAPGDYTVQYHAVEAADGHAVDGSFGFRVLPAAAGPPPEPSLPGSSAVGSPVVATQQETSEATDAPPSLAESDASGSPASEGSPPNIVLGLVALTAVAALVMLVRRRSARRPADGPKKERS